MFTNKSSENKDENVAVATTRTAHPNRTETTTTNENRKRNHGLSGVLSLIDIYIAHKAFTWIPPDYHRGFIFWYFHSLRCRNTKYNTPTTASAPATIWKKANITRINANQTKNSFRLFFQSYAKQWNEMKSDSSGSIVSKRIAIISALWSFKACCCALNALFYKAQWRSALIWFNCNNWRSGFKPKKRLAAKVKSTFLVMMKI